MVIPTRFTALSLHKILYWFHPLEKPEFGIGFEIFCFSLEFGIGSRHFFYFSGIPIPEIPEIGGQYLGADVFAPSTVLPTELDICKKAVIAT